MMALGLGRAGAFAQEPIEHVDQGVERIQRFIAFHARDQIGPADLNVAFREKSLAGILRPVVLEVDAEADDVLLVAQKPGGLFLCRRLQGRRKLEMRATHDDAWSGGRNSSGKLAWGWRLTG